MTRRRSRKGRLFRFAVVSLHCCFHFTDCFHFSAFAPLRPSRLRCILPLVSGRIHILPDDLASQIAAGEVVERPASVVKELVENSLDAGAKRIDVTIESGGITLIEVADDGCGMSPEDAPLCLGRHATSKISDFASLLSLASYGFRGEALPSIASVSRLAIKTRDEGTESGLLLSAQGTIRPEAVPVGSPVGTTITVRDLFFNVPARLKFLRSTNTEAGHVSEVLIDAALARPDVSFTLTRDGKSQKQFHRARNRRERVEQVLSAEDLFCAEGTRGPLHVEAYLNSPERSRRGAGGLKLLVNARPVKDRALFATIAHAFGGALARGHYPRGVIYLTLQPDLVDVNVHPQKTEVRFSDPRAVADAVHQVIKRGLPSFAGTVNVPKVTVAPFESAPDASGTSGTSSPPRAEKTTRATPLALEAPGRLVRDSAGSAFGERYRMEPAPKTPSSRMEAARGDERLGTSLSRTTDPDAARRRAPFRFVAQVRRSYLVVESDEGLSVLDQHAADETRIFRALMERLTSGQIPEQALLFPVTVHWGERVLRASEAQGGLIAQLGFELRNRGGGAVSLHSVPRLLVRTAPEKILEHLASVLGQTKQSDVFAQELLCRLACQEALGLGERLNQQDAEQLVRSLDVPLENARCIHGRPLLSDMSFAELARKDSQQR